MHINGTHLDVHGLTLSEAKTVINKSIQQCYENGTAYLKVNHGFNNGNKIKNWCLNKSIENPLVIKVENGENEGITILFIKLKLF